MSKKVLDKAYNAIAAPKRMTKPLVGKRRAVQRIQKQVGLY